MDGNWIVWRGLQLEKLWFDDLFLICFFPGSVMKQEGNIWEEKGSNVLGWAEDPGEQQSLNVQGLGFFLVWLCPWGCWDSRSYRSFGNRSWENLGDFRRCSTSNIFGNCVEGLWHSKCDLWIPAVHGGDAGIFWMHRGTEIPHFGTLQAWRCCSRWKNNSWGAQTSNKLPKNALSK